MIDLYYCTSPNVIKILIMLEEIGADYRVIPIDISAGAHLTADFQRISPNAKLPAIVDRNADTGATTTLFESGAILQYLAETSGRFLPAAAAERWTVIQWLHWQVANLGPISGQNRHFRLYGPRLRPEADLSYGLERYTVETNRLYAVLDRQLEGRDYICTDYSIADMACYPWILLGADLGQDFADFPVLTAWMARMKARPAVVRAYAGHGAQVAQVGTWDADTQRVTYPWAGLARNIFFNSAALHREPPGGL